MSTILETLQIKQIRKYHYEKSNNELALSMIDKDIQEINILIIQMSKFKIPLDMGFKSKDKIELEKLLLESYELEIEIGNFETECDIYDDLGLNYEKELLSEMKTQLYCIELQINEIIDYYKI